MFLHDFESFRGNLFRRVFETGLFRGGNSAVFLAACEQDARNGTHPQNGQQGTTFCSCDWHVQRTSPSSNARIVEHWNEQLIGKTNGKAKRKNW
jgi:hypothetical protein